MLKSTYYFKLDDVNVSQKEFNEMSFGRQIEFFNKMKQFKLSAKSVHISQKRRTTAAAMKEFKELYQPSEYYTKVVSGTDYKDDSIEIWYKNAS